MLRDLIACFTGRQCDLEIIYLKLSQMHQGAQSMYYLDMALIHRRITGIGRGLLIMCLALAVNGLDGFIRGVIALLT